MKPMRVALCQMRVGTDKGRNLHTARNMVRQAAEQQAQMIILPEIFNAPYEAARFEQYAEAIPGPSSEALQDMAREYQAVLVGGSIIERDREGRLFNTCLVFGANGVLLAQHRKVHLFDINIPGKLRFQESQTLSAGNNITLFEVNGWKAAVLICYDIRFPEMLRLATLAGADLLIVPAAFNLTTGPLHWELLMRSRAMDSQAYVIACSPARDESASYQAWGHSMLVDPWGRIIAQADQGEEIIMGDLKPGEVARVRAEIPVLAQRRSDLYDTIARKPGLIIERRTDREGSY